MATPTTDPQMSRNRLLAILAINPKAKELLSAIPQNAGPLTKETICDLWEFFHTHTKHRPSQDMWAALADIAQCLEDMANSQCAPNYYLSSLDPGVGKTRTIVTFTKALLRSSAHDDVGMVIFLGRLDEIDKLVKEMALDPADFAVLTSNEDKNALGSDNPNTARVLFTTQQMLVSRGEGKDFMDIEEFQYEGRRREVKIWDETMLPARPITLNRAEMHEVIGRIMKLNPLLGNELDEYEANIVASDNGDVYSFPDFANDHEVDVNEIIRLLDDAPDGHKRVARDLWLLSGKAVKVRKDKQRGSVLIDYQEVYAPDLVPVLILDASGRVKETYKEWFNGSRNDLVDLQPALKSYRHLTVNLWNHRGGKDAFREDLSTLIEGIGNAILTKPKEEWLICHHKPETAFNVEKALTQYLKAKGVKTDNLHFLSYGNHMATNEFAHVQNVLLAGILYYPVAVYESLARLSSKMPPEDNVSPDVMKRIRQGECADLILQALCRGSVRYCQTDGTCRPCNVYVIAANGTGINKAIPEIFPDCTMNDWRPVTKELTGCRRQAYDYIMSFFDDSHDTDYIPFNKVYGVLGMSSPDFRRKVRNDTEFQTWIAQSNIIEGCSPNGKLTDPFNGKRKSGFWNQRYLLREEV